MEKRITKKDIVTRMLADENIVAVAEYKEFLEKELASLNKKAENRKPTKVQTENEALKVKVMAIMTTDNVTATEVMNKVDGIGSNQKATAILKALKEEGKVVRVEDGKKVFYTLATADADTEEGEEA